MRRGHVGSPRQWLCFLMLLGMWVQALVKHFVQTSHLVINNWYFRSILNVGFAGLSPVNVSYPSWAVWWCRWGWPWGQRESERLPIRVSYNIPSLHLFCIGHLFASQTPAHILISSFKGPAPENCKLELRKQVSSLPGAYLICKRQTCWEMPFKVNSWNFITCAGLWTSPGQPLLGCWIGYPGAAARLPAQADPVSRSPAGLDHLWCCLHGRHTSSDNTDNSVWTKRTSDSSSNEQKWQCGGTRWGGHPSRAPQSSEEPCLGKCWCRRGREPGQSHWDAKWLGECHVKDVQFAGKWKELFSQGTREALSQQNCDNSHFPTIFGVKDTLDI